MLVRNFTKKILFLLPRSFRTRIVLVRELWWNIVMRQWEKTVYPQLSGLSYKKGLPTSDAKNILIYHINGLTHAGTEKNLQFIANGLAKSHRVFFMYGDKNAEEGRKAILNPKITLIPFSYEKNEIAVPHKLSGMKPHIKEVITEHNIDLIVTASPGYAHYPWNVITEIPIILLNIFGAPTIQKNIKKIIYISGEVRKHAEKWTGYQEVSTVAYCPIANPPTQIDENLRSRLGIPDNAFVLGRIGRADDSIFDPIGIRAFAQAVQLHRTLHYIIMSPPPILEKIVAEEKIPNVHFLPPSGKESDVWVFHRALDVFAHFRKDGETSGVAIAESLTIGNPVITHKSTIWNAHLEYLKDDFAKVADIDNISSYTRYIVEFIELKRDDTEKWQLAREKARLCGEYNFSSKKYSEKILDIVKKI